jgi:UDP-N-acetylglucosamine 4-epimerase
VRDSQADVDKARRLLGYDPRFDVLTGLELAIEWYRTHLA